MHVLYGYWRSSATYRVRIGANLKKVNYRSVSINLLEKEQYSESYAKLNPEKLLPAFVLDDGTVLTQSMAILEYLEEAYPHGVALLPTEPQVRCRVRAFANAISSDTHPIQNLRVLNFLESEYGLDKDSRTRWIKHWINTSFTALEATAKKRKTKLLFGESPTLAELCLIPQIYNARRFGVDMSKFPHLDQIDGHCNQIKAFQEAHPELHKEQAQ